MQKRNGGMRERGNGKVMASQSGLYPVLFGVLLTKRLRET